MSGKSKNLIIVGCARAGGATLLAFLLSYLLLQPLSFSAISLFSSPEKNDTSMTDLYVQVANDRPVCMLDSDIVIINIGHSNRAEIADIVEQVNFWQPKVIGMDILFAGETSADSLLLSAMREVVTLVVPVGLDEADSGRFEIVDRSFFYSDPHFKVAASNFASKYEGSTIREFATYFPLTVSDTIMSFPMAVAMEYDPESIVEIDKRGNRFETIDYASREFITLAPDDVMANGDLLTNKIVLIGAISDATDLHLTPINSKMSGLNIHAASIATILGGRYFDPVFTCPPWMPAGLLCFFILLVREFTVAKMRGCVTRFLQLLIVYLVVRIGYSLYVDHYRIFDLSYTLLMLMFGLFAADILMGIEYLGDKSCRWAKRYINRCKSTKSHNIK